MPFHCNLASPFSPPNVPSPPATLLAEAPNKEEEEEEKNLPGSNFSLRTVAPCYLGLTALARRNKVGNLPGWNSDSSLHSLATPLAS